MFIRLTQPDGKPVWLKSDSISRVSEPGAGAPPDSGASLNGGQQYVRETPEAILIMLESGQPRAGEA